MDYINIFIGNKSIFCTPNDFRFNHQYIDMLLRKLIKGKENDFKSLDKKTI